jgi:hypothetical protein
VSGYLEGERAVAATERAARATVAAGWATAGSGREAAARARAARAARAARTAARATAAAGRCRLGEKVSAGRIAPSAPLVAERMAAASWNQVVQQEPYALFGVMKRREECGRER